MSRVLPNDSNNHAKNSVTKNPVAAVYPVTPAQKRLWILDQLNPDDTSYNLLISVKISGELDQRLFSQAVNLVVHKHESLRANIIKSNQKLEQHISRHKSVDIDVHDYCNRANAIEHIKQLFSIEANTRFDLEKDQLFRFTLTRLSEELHVFIVNIHHIITDGWSMSNFVKELGQCYQSILNKDLTKIYTPSISLDEIVKQKVDYLETDKYQEGMSYWLEKLKDSSPEVEFNQIKPVQKDNDVLKDNNGHRHFFKINSELLSKLKKLALEQGVTLNMLMLAQYFILLHRYTQQKDISIGSPVAARKTQAEFDSIAFFVNSIVFREKIESKARFSDFLSSVKQTSINGLKYQDIPFINLVEALNPERSSNANPLYNVSFAFQNMQKPDSRYGELNFELINLDFFNDDEFAWLENDTGHALFDLTLEVIQTHKESLVATFEYNSKLFDQAMITRMTEHFINLLESLCNDPQQKISDIVFLTEQEQHQQLVQWQSQTVPLSATAVHHLFEQQVERSPEAIAIRWNKQSINYRSLNEKSNQLAHYLIEKGIKRGDQVGICLGRSFDMIIAVLATIKTGACYMPMDITYPEQRLHYMMEEVNAPILLTESIMQSMFSFESGTFDNNNVFLMDQHWTLVENLPKQNPDAQTHQDDPFYTIFTSGSTGRPKGASVSHLCEINMLDWYTRTAYPMSVNEKVLIMSAFGFDLTQKNIFAPLTSGATLVLPEFNEYEPRKLTQLIAQEQVTWTTCTPSALNPLVEDSNYWHELTSLRYVFFGGEPLKIDKMKAWQQQSQCQLVNTFGPTECTDIAAYHHLEDLDLYAHRNVPIGKPNGNVELYVLDENQNLLPQGMTGEICIGGSSVGLGYINRAELTAEKFIKNPFNDDPKAKLYRTGDLGRYQDCEGNIEHAGRIDFQLKLRGLRIELGEIEFGLQQQDAIKEALAMVVDDQIVAYLTTNKAVSIDEQQLKEKLLKFLPQYMVPQHFIMLEKFPLTAHGKIDRVALPEFTAQVTNDYVAPETELQHTLASIWSKVLDVEKVGIEDNFFDLGGHSLLATQLVSRIVADIQQDLSLKAIFDHPTIAELAQYMDDGNYQNDKALISIPKSDIKNNQYPLSFSQQRLWFIQKLEPDSHAYTMPAVINLSGHLDYKALEHSFLKIVQRHDILRARFIETDELVFQMIDPVNDWIIPVHDLSNLEGGIKDESIKETIEKQFNQPFNLVSDSLLRTKLIKTEHEKHKLIVAMHHIISDGWSINLLMKELSECYQAFCNNKATELQTLPIQYVDFSQWQNNYLQGDVLEQELAFWTEKLQDVTTLELSTDFPRPAKQTFNGDKVQLYIEPELTHKLKTIERQEGVTLFMTLLTGLNILLKHYSGQNDICIGSPIANRNHKDLENLIGLFVNTLVLRQEIKPDQSIQSLLQAIKHTTLDAYAHQNTPFEKIVDSLDIEHSLSHTPLFQIMFVLQNQNNETIKLQELDVEFLPHDNHTAKFDLTFNVEELKDGLDISLEYNTDLFNKETVSQLLKHFETVLKAMVNDLTQSVDRVSLLSLMEKKKILFDFNQNQFLAESDPCLHHMIELQAEALPDQKALVYKNESITYQQLNQLSNQLAHCLVDKGVTKGSFVGVFIERSIDMVIGVLATIKAGAVYVPMDPSYPDERINYMLEDSQANTILTSESLKKRLHQSEQKVFCMDTQWNMVTDYLPDNLSIPMASEDLAYMIYTSGSTGQPKGVLCHHKGLVNLINDYQHKKMINPGEHCSAWSTFSFDASVYEIFTALTAGGVLHIMEEDIRNDGAKVIEYFYKHQINHSFFPAVYLREFRQWLSDNPGKSVMKRIMTGVESIEELLLVDIQSQCDDLQIINSYGPTEGTIICLAYLVDTEHPSEQHNAPIGTPVENVQIYILDEYQNPVPIGVKGEIYVGGLGVTDGYWNNEELTSEKFIANTFSPHKSKTLYRTGDIARYLPDGNIQFIGRCDNQIKLRGYRIELGEIETRLKALPVINEAIVTVFEGTDNNKRLVAYITIDHSNMNNEINFYHQYFRKQLSGVLPEYMIPGSYIVLEEFPLLPNGKLDKKSLPEPSVNREEQYKAPETEQEKILVEIWSEILKVKKVGVNDNFFDLGGHSLIATQIISRINKAFKSDLQVMQLFEAPYIDQLALLIGETKNNQAEYLPLHKRPMDCRPELSFSQERIWFLDKYEPNNTAYNIPMVLSIEGDLDIITLEKTFRTIIQRHEILRTNFIEDENGQLLQSIRENVNWKLSINDLQSLKKCEQHDQANSLIDQMVNASFDLSDELLFRASLVLLDKKTNLLLLNIHHIVSDGWSMGLLLNEVDRIYRALCNDAQFIAIPDLPIQYADYSHWQKQMHAQNKFQHQFKYWKEQLSDIAVLELPIDKNRPAIQTFNGQHHAFNLSEKQSQLINDVCQKHQVSPFMFFMSVLNTMLYRYTNQSDICVGTPVAGRNHQETESLIGLFVNTLAIRSHLNKQLSFSQLLQQVKQTTLNAYANQDAPFDRIVEELELPRNLSTTPVFQVMLAMQNSPIEALEFSGLTITPNNIDNPTAKFDLLLDVNQRDQNYLLSFEYNTDLFNHSSILAMGKRFVLLLESACHSLDINEEIMLKDMNFLEQHEINDQLVNWQSQSFTLKHTAVHEMFEEQVEKTPDATAIRCNEQSLDYKTLNFKANQLAHYLQSQGIKRQDQVGICLGRSFNMIIAVMAVIKTGACYMPMDITYPEQRLKYMLEEVNAPILITETSMQNLLSFDADKTFIIDQQWEKVSTLSPDNLQAESHKDDPFYTIFTSGSTGRPKGASVSHLCEINMLDWYTDTTYPMSSDEKVLVMSAFGFDLTQKNIFAPLTRGAILVLPEFNEYDPRLLTQLIHKEQVTWTTCTPSALNPLVEDPDYWHELESMKFVFFGGEPLKVDKMKAWQQQSQCQLVNTYGPTECTDIAAYHHLGNLDDYEHKNIPIGKPNANVELYILDNDLNLLPAGMTGEICIGGSSVGLGYITQPELTKEKFIKNPFKNNPDAKIYRTGDLGRYQDDRGNIEHAGRIDFQLKLRGLRIELGEIEYSLQQQDGVKESLVVVIEGQIVAYLTTKMKLDEHKLKEDLAKFLPQYMIPVHYVQLEAFPLTQHGKIDRKALPEFVAQVNDDFIAPDTDIEKQLVNIWTDVLFANSGSDAADLNPIGVKDNFFSLGGNSLQASQIIARIRTHYQIDVPVKTLFTEPTIAALAALIEQGAGSFAVSNDTIIQRVSRDDEFDVNTDFLYEDEESDEEADEEFEI